MFFTSFGSMGTPVLSGWAKTSSQLMVAVSLPAASNSDVAWGEKTILNMSFVPLDSVESPSPSI